MRIDWKSVADVAGMLAILTGLVFVFEELRLSRTIARAELSLATGEMLNVVDQLEHDPEFAATLVKSFEHPENLNAAEKVQLNAYLFMVLKVYLREQYNHERGIFPEWTSVISVTAPKYFGAGYGRAYWNVRKQLFQPEIVAAVDEALENTRAVNFYKAFDGEIARELSRGEFPP